jgi:hypothetical protein
MKPLRHALFAGSLGLLSLVGCSHSARAPETTPSPGLQTPSPAAATPAPAQTTGTTNEPISAPVNDPTITTSPTNSGLGGTQNPITQPAPVGGPAPTDSDRTPPPPIDMTDDPDLTSTPGAQPLTPRDAGTPVPKPSPDEGTKPEK